MISQLSDKLSRNGYLVVPGFLAKDQLEDLRQVSSKILSSISREHREKFRATGSLCNFGDHPEYASLVANFDVAKIMDTLGYDTHKWLAGYLISKPGYSPPLFWHQDWWGWSNPISYQEKPLSLGFMYYLSDTSRKNGCLRVIPGSHRRWHKLHGLPAAHNEQLSQAKDLDNIAFKSHADEVAVEIRAGDLLIMDSRLLHSTYPNGTSDERTLLTLWYLPEFSQMPNGIRNRYSNIFARKELDIDADMKRVASPCDWPEESKKITTHLFPEYEGNAAQEHWERTPEKLKMMT